MHHLNISGIRREFDPVLSTSNAQVAVMTLKAGTASDDKPSNEHPTCEQWLVVLAGSGEAIIGKPRHALRRVALRKNSILVIEKGELHQIKNTGATLMRTINFYVPPAYYDSKPISTTKSGSK